MNPKKTLQEEYKGVSLIYMNNDIDGGDDWRWFIAGHRTTADITKEDCMAFIDSMFGSLTNLAEDWNKWLAFRAKAKGGPRTDLLRRLADGLRESYVSDSPQDNRMQVNGVTDLVRFYMGCWQLESDHELECGFAACAIGLAPYILGDDCPISLVIDSTQEDEEGYKEVFYTPIHQSSGTSDYAAVIEGFNLYPEAVDHLFDSISYTDVSLKIHPLKVAERIEEFCNEWEAQHG